MYYNLSALPLALVKGETALLFLLVLNLRLVFLGARLGHFVKPVLDFLVHGGAHLTSMLPRNRQGLRNGCFTLERLFLSPSTLGYVVSRGRLQFDCHTSRVLGR